MRWKFMSVGNIIFNAWNREVMRLAHNYVKLHGDSSLLQSRVASCDDPIHRYMLTVVANALDQDDEISGRRVEVVGEENSAAAAVGRCSEMFLDQWRGCATVTVCKLHHRLHLECSSSMQSLCYALRPSGRVVGHRFLCALERVCVCSGTYVHIHVGTIMSAIRVVDLQKLATCSQARFIRISTVSIKL